MPAAMIQDNASSCRSSPMSWNPMPVPVPAFDGFRELAAAADENVSWEQCMRLLNNSGRSLAAAYPIYGSSADRHLRRSGTPSRYLVQSPEHGVPRNLSARLAEVKVEDVTTMRDRFYPTSVSRATSPMPSECSDFPTAAGGSKDESPQRNAGANTSILRRFFGHRAAKKSVSRSSSFSSMFRAEEPYDLGGTGGAGVGGGGKPKRPTKSPGPQPRLSSVGLTGDADPRISSTNLAADAFYCGEEVGAGHMNRWLQQQEWMTMAAKAEAHLSELSEMLQYTVKSLGDLKAADHAAEEVQQRQKCLYYAT